VYEGVWLKGQKYLKDTMKYKNGDVYEGDWQCDVKWGEGTMKYANGDVYVGHWSDNKKDGKGKMTHENGDVILETPVHFREGIWKNDWYTEDVATVLVGGFVYTHRKPSTDYY
jgi:hypothetical protein